MATKKSWTYKKAGVNIVAGDALVDRIKKRLPAIGNFAGLFPFPKGLQKPYLVGCTDGVGTKLKVAQELGRHDTIGIDLVAMNVNDLICTGARPLFFLDYFATGHLDVGVAERVINGMINGCKQAGCALIGGETAEMPGFYKPGEYDLAGFSVGVVDDPDRIHNEKIRPGDVLLGLPSSGVHSNGYSLVRVLFRGADLKKWGTALLAPTKIYVKPVLAALKKFSGSIKGVAHITGGGLTENVPRFLPKNCNAVIHLATWPMPDVFNEIRRRGNVTDTEMYRTFNMGLGLVLAVAPAKAAAIKKFLSPCYEVGRVEKGQRVVLYR